MKKTSILLVILVCICSFQSFGQIKTTKYFDTSTALCSTTLMLDSLGYFFYEAGCEGRSNISYGKYKIREKNLIEFKFLNFDSLPTFLKIINGSFAKDSMVTLKFLTRQGYPLSNNSPKIDAIDSSGKFYETLRFNDSGEVKVNYKKYHNLRFAHLSRILNREIKIQLTNHNQIFYLSLPRIYFYYSNPRIGEGNNDMKLYLKKDGLYDIDNKTKAYSIIK